MVQSRGVARCAAAGGPHPIVAPRRMAYPMGLPEWDLVRMLLHDDDGAVLESIAGADYFDPATAT